MKTPRSQESKPDKVKKTAEEPTPTISAAEYAALPEEKKALYRPVDPKYEKLPVVCIVLYAIAAVCLGLYVAMQFSASFADWFNRTVGAAGRWLLSTLTAWIPFSVGELHVDGMITLTPHEHGTDGFFLAKLQKGC